MYRVPSHFTGEAMQEGVGHIVHLFLKPSHGAAMVPCSFFEGRAGYGLCGDIHAQPMSPRQILLVRQEDLEEYVIQPGALRENVVVAGLAPEVFVPGALVRVGTLSLRMTFFCEACKRIAPVVPSLKTLGNKRGLLGVVLSDGGMHVGERVAFRTQQFAPLAPIPYQRFLHVVRCIPAGRIATYRQIVCGMGVAESYLRALPGYIQRTSPEAYPLHRIVDSAGHLLSTVPNQQQHLEAEGIRLLPPVSLVDELGPKRLSLPQYVWDDPLLYLR